MGSLSWLSLRPPWSHTLISPCALWRHLIPTSCFSSAAFVFVSLDTTSYTFVRHNTLLSSFIFKDSPVRRSSYSPIYKSSICNAAHVCTWIYKLPHENPVWANLILWAHQTQPPSSCTCAHLATFPRMCPSSQLVQLGLWIFSSRSLFPGTSPGRQVWGAICFRFIPLVRVNLTTTLES